MAKYFGAAARYHLARLVASLSPSLPPCNLASTFGGRAADPPARFTTPLQAVRPSEQGAGTAIAAAPVATAPRPLGG
jgi:hypothetical protein